MSVISIGDDRRSPSPPGGESSGGVTSNVPKASTASTVSGTGCANASRPSSRPSAATAGSV